MFDVGFTELVLLFVIGLLILGPERLPRVAAQLGRWMGKARRTAHQLRMQLEREMTMSDIMRDKKDREQKKTESESESTAADSSAEDSYPEEEDANDSGHQDADSDATAAPEPVATASSDDKQSAANDSDSVQQRRA